MSTYQPSSDDTYIVKYADDVALVLHVYKDNPGDISHVISDIDFFHQWCNLNGMTVNVNKCTVNPWTLVLEEIPYQLYLIWKES